MSTTQLQEYKGRFGTVVVDYGARTAVKTTALFYHMLISNEPHASSVRDAFYADRLRDMVLDHPYILPILRIEIDKRGNEKIAALKAAPISTGVQEYDLGLQITMRACRLSLAGDGVYREPTLLNLFDIYKPHLTHPSWIAYVGEIILNLADAVAYLHDQGLAHLDITQRNVLVDAEPLEGKVDELFNKTRVYLADRGGKALTQYCYALVQETNRDPSFTGADRNPRTKVESTRQMYGKSTDSFTDEEVNHCEVLMLGSLAATLLTGKVFGIGGTSVRSLDEKQYVAKNSGLQKASSLIDVVRMTGLEFDESGVYTPYTSVGTFITALKHALQQHFYVLPREALPRETQQQLGIGRQGYVVCTPERFVQLMYGGKRLLSRAERGSLLHTFTNPYSGTPVSNIVSPKIPLDTSVASIPEALVQGILTFQGEIIEQRKKEVAKQRSAVEERKAKLESEGNGFETEYSALDTDFKEIETMKKRVHNTKPQEQRT